MLDFKLELLNLCDLLTAVIEGAAFSAEAPAVLLTLCVFELLF